MSGVGKAVPWILISALSYVGAWSALYQFRMWARPYPWSGVDTIGCAVASIMLVILMLVLVAATHSVKQINK